MRIHLVYEVDYLEQLKEMLGEAGHEIAGWDYSLPLFADFSEKKTVDADLALIDGQAGVTEKREIIEALGRIRKNLPELRLVVIFPTVLEKDEKFKEKLLSYSLYDMYFRDEYDIDDLEHWFGNPKTYGNYDIQTDDIAGTLPQREPVQASKKQEERGGLLKKGIDTLLKINLKEKFAKKESSEKEDTHETKTGAFASDFFVPPQDRNVYATAKKKQKKPVVYSWDMEYEGVTAFKDIGQLFALAEMVRPDFILMPGHKEEVAEKIREIKRHKKLWDLPVVVVGNISHELYKAGADECLPEWNDDSFGLLAPKLDSLRLIKEMSKSEALKDPLTGAYNRLFMEELLDKSIREYNMHGVPFCGLFCDLDYFKRLNDTYGHQVGDDVLKAFVSFLNENTRSGDFVTRYGGEEFLLLFSATTAKEMACKIDNMRLAWQEKDLYGSTFSGALADYLGEGKELFLRKLDEALYMAKNAGRNRVIYVEEDESISPPADLRCTPGGGFQTSVYAVAGAAPRVGATSFALMLAKEFALKYPVEILDAGGGAYDWLGGRGAKNINVRKAPPYSITPGVVTIIDAGTGVHDELKPFVETTFVVTDMSKKAVYIKNLVKGPAWLVGNRCVNDIKKLGQTWGLPVLLEIKHEEGIREAEKRGTFPEIKSVSRILKAHI